MRMAVPKTLQDMFYNTVQIKSYMSNNTTKEKHLLNLCLLYDVSNIATKQRQQFTLTLLYLQHQK